LETKLQNLDDRIDTIDGRMDKVEGHLIAIKDAVSAGDEKSSNRTFNIIMTIFGVILTALLGIIAKGLFQ
jgi:hypothetical protein